MGTDLSNIAKKVISDRNLTFLSDRVVAAEGKRGGFSVSFPSRDCTNLVRQLFTLCKAIDHALIAEKQPPQMHLFILELVPDLTQLFHLCETGLLLQYLESCYKLLTRDQIAKLIRDMRVNDMWDCACSPQKQYNDMPLHDVVKLFLFRLLKWCLANDTNTDLLDLLKLANPFDVSKFEPIVPVGLCLRLSNDYVQAIKNFGTDNSSVIFKQADGTLKCGKFTRGDCFPHDCDLGKQTYTLMTEKIRLWGIDRKCTVFVCWYELLSSVSTFFFPSLVEQVPRPKRTEFDV
jgi:hypothetical protein